MPRFTIKRLMIAVSLVAGLLALYRAFGLVAPIWSTLSLSTSGLVWLVVRQHPPLAPWMFVISTVLGNIPMFFLCAFSYDYPVEAFLYLSSFVTTALALGSGLIWISARPNGGRLPKAGAWFIVLILGLMPLSMTFTLWPLRLAFALSRPSMERLADRVVSGGSVKSPEWAGLYLIVRAESEPRNGNVALFIDVNPGGRLGFVRVQDPQDTLGPMVGLNCNEPVGGRWRFQTEE